MALRRPRVKACANLSTKRKIKKECDETNTTGDSVRNLKLDNPQTNENKTTEDNSDITKIKEKLEAAPISNAQETSTIDTIADADKQKPTLNPINLETHNTTVVNEIQCSPTQSTISKCSSTVEVTNNANFKCPTITKPNSEVSNALDTSIVLDLKSPPHYPNLEYSTSSEHLVNDFKCPQNVEKKEKSNSIPGYSSVTDIAQIYTDTSQQQQNMSNSSPIKHRQRIRPMPFFGIRRNSIQGSNTESEDESRRNHKLNTPTILQSPISEYNKMNSFNYNRKRTESTCSNVSESGRPTDRPRKVYITEESQRIATAKKEFNVKFDGGIPDKSVLKMFDFIYYNPMTNPMKQVQKTASDDDNKSINNESQQSTDNSESEKNEKNKETIEKEDVPNIPVPQLKLGANGELVLDETSLVIETTAGKEAREKLATSSIIYVDENTENNGFYKRQKRTRDWSPEETIKFYRCLHTVGTDFSLMLTLFPNRTRRDLKLKFKKEEKQNLALINKALLYPKTFDIEELKSELEKDEEEAAEKQRKWEDIKRRNQMQKDAVKSKSNKKSKSARTLNHGDIAYENENLVSAKRKRRKSLVITEYHNNSTNSFQVTTPTDEVFAENDDPRINNNKQDDAVTEQKLFDALVNTENCNDLEEDAHDISTEDSDSQNNAIKTDLNADHSEQPECEPQFEESTEIKPAKLEKKFYSNISNVLKEIANGSLVAVSSEDPDDPDKIINEIYVVYQESGELSDEPLDLPEDVLECIMSAISL